MNSKFALTPAQMKTLGEDVWKKSEKINAELFLWTYGSLVVQLMRDFEEDSEVNKQLETIGYNIGCRLIEDFLAKSQWSSPCSDFRETADAISKIGFKMFINATPIVSNWSSDGKEFSFIFDENPLAEFVEWPPAVNGSFGNRGADIWYSNILCGVIRGALEMVQIQTSVEFVSDQLKGDDTTEIRVKLLRFLEEQVPIEDD